VCKRRQIVGSKTFLVFVDIKKAYDTVPHEALFRKLEAYGVRGRMLQYLRALYENSTIQVRAGDPPRYQVSEPVPLKRGLRQGCPLSPVLFNVFVNDILYGMDMNGAPVPGMPGEKIPGLLFADDLVLIAPTKEDVEEMLSKLTRWLDVNEMEVGISKCGIMAVGSLQDQASLSERPDRWQIAGKVVPVVTDYRYLGIVFRRELDVVDMMSERLVQARKVVLATSPFLKSASMPMIMRVLVLKAVVVPVLLYGAEIYGMCRIITDKVQVFLNQAMRAMAGVSRQSPVSNVALWREFRVPPICASAAARRARAWKKCAGSRTWMGKMAVHRLVARKRTWWSGAKTWIARYVGRLTEEAGMDGAWERMEPKDMAQHVQAVVWQREERRSQFRGQTAQRYLRYKMQDRPVYRVGGSHHPSMTLGLNTIVKCRIGGLWTASRLARHGLIDRRYMNVCPCCNRGSPEDLFHLLWECPRWERPRREWLWEMRNDASFLACINDGDKDGVVALLLGGEVRGSCIQGWCTQVNDPVNDRPVEESDDDDDDNAVVEDDSSVSTQESEPEALEPGIDVLRRMSGCQKVARYLACMVKARSLIIKGLA